MQREETKQRDHQPEYTRSNAAGLVGPPLLLVFANLYMVDTAYNPLVSDSAFGCHDWYLYKHLTHNMDASYEQAASRCRLTMSCWVTSCMDATC